MNILITGMQRTGTTLLRRIVTIHPQVKRIFHETFFLTKCLNPVLMKNRINSMGINFKNDIWGEKCPYYPNIRKMKVEQYCETLHNWFPNKFRVIHIVRHPMDVAISNVKKFKYVKSIVKPIEMYNAIIPRIVPNLMEMPYVIQIKYEHLLTEPDIVIPKIYKFCNLKPNINFRKNLKKLENPRYQEIDSSRSFAYLKSEQKLKVDFSEVFKIVNRLDGPEYK